MIIASFIGGLLGGMNNWVSHISDIRWHLNDVYMSALMIVWMFLLHKFIMLETDITGYIILILAILSIIYVIHNQIFISDNQYIISMIPHHSMAVTMSEHILNKTKNPKIKKLALNIINSQNKEIQDMKNIESELEQELELEQE